MGVCLKQHGTIEALLHLVSANGLAPDQELKAGDNLNTDTGYKPVSDSFEAAVITQDQVQIIQAQEGQDILDLTLQEYGTIEEVIRLLNDNKTAFEDHNGLPDAGTLLNIDTTAARASAIRQVLALKQVYISTHTDYTPPIETSKPLKDWLASDYNKQDFL